MDFFEKPTILSFNHIHKKTSHRTLPTKEKMQQLIFLWLISPIDVDQ